MPRVPLIGLPSRQQQPTRSGTFTVSRVTPMQDATGVQLRQFGESLVDAGTAATDIATLLQSEVDNARTAEAYTLWNDAIGRSLNDAETGYLNTAGKAATGTAPDEVQRLIADKRQELAKGLDNDVQRLMFQRIADRRMVDVRNLIRRHEAAEIRSYGAAQAKTMRLQAMSNAADAWVAGLRGAQGGDLGPGEQGPPVADRPAQGHQLYLNTAKAQAQKEAQLLGVPVEGLVRETVSGIHASIVDQLADLGRGSEAKKYLQGVDEDELAPGVGARLRSLVHRASVKEEAQLLVFDIVADVQTKQVSRTPETGEMGPIPLQAIAADADEVLAVGRARLDDLLKDERISIEVYDAARLRLDKQVDNILTAEAAAADAVRQRSEQALSADRNMSPFDLSAADQDLLIRTGQWSAILNFAKNTRHVNDPEFVALWMNAPPEMYLRHTNGALLRTQLRPHMDNPTLEKAMSLWAKAHERSDELEDRNWTTVQELHQQLMTSFPDAFPRDTKGNIILTRDTGRLYDNILEEVNKRVLDGMGPDEREAEIKRILSDTVLRTRGRNLLLPAVSLDPEERPESFVTVSVPVSEAETEEAEIDVSKIPSTMDISTPGAEMTDGVAQRIVMTLHKNGIPVTHQNVAQAWVNLGQPRDVDELEEIQQLISQAEGDRHHLFPGDPTTVTQRQLSAFEVREIGLGVVRRRDAAEAEARFLTEDERIFLRDASRVITGRVVRPSATFGGGPTPRPRAKAAADAARRRRQARENRER